MTARRKVDIMLYKPTMGAAAFAATALFFAAILMTAVPVIDKGGLGF